MTSDPTFLFGILVCLPTALALFHLIDPETVELVLGDRVLLAATAAVVAVTAVVLAQPAS